MRNFGRRRPIVAAICAVTLVLPTASAVAAPGHPQARVGAQGAGDPYFPRSGNGGFHVAHYGLNLAYNPKSGVLAGTADLQAVATQTLSRFDLDLSGLTVDRIRVNGAKVTFVRHGQELVITPRRNLGKGKHFTVGIRYHGVPQDVTDPDGSPDGWIRTDTGAFVGSEPQGAMTWFPANSHPIDKSAFDVTMRVPKGYLAVGNGKLVAQKNTAKFTTTHWRQQLPMAAYLATASVAKFQVQQYKIANTPVFIAVDPREAAASAPVLATLPAVIAWERSLFGPYPFGALGAIVMHAPSVGYALETQTRPLFNLAPDEATLVHELAHQWFGDSVSVTRWKDIWLNEGFATYAEWLWSEHSGGLTAQQQFDQRYAEPATANIWIRPVANPGSGENIFDTPVYDRGAMVLHELRLAVGDTAFFTILRTWVAQHHYGHGTTAQFTALATQISHQNLTALFHTWLYTAGKPAHA